MKRLVNFFILVINEIIKIFTKISTCIFIFLLIVIIAFIAIKAPAKVSKHAYINKLSSEVQQKEKKYGAVTAKDIKKEDNLFSFIDKKDYVLNKYALQHNIIYNYTSLWSIVNKALLLEYMVGIFLIIAAANIVSNEYKDGTIKFLLIRPYKRWQILLSKWTALLALYFGFILLIITVSIIIGGLKYGFDGFNMKDLYISNTGFVKERSMLVYQLILFAGKSINDIMAFSIAFMLSTIIKNNSLAIVGSVAVLFSGFILSLFGNRYWWIRFTPFPHMDLTQYLPDSTPLINGCTITYSAIILLLYFTVIHAVTIYVFGKRTID
ncbi:ABC transporter permease [Clostridium oryzae]|uniref:ABC-2 family transporter protein n=1 Tax=Clostridium oryzae TaxID=1450648 RepID=A0A1V4I5G2_9CLOT|nr:ABC transporter permease subunit [Clostridium oryzae]OPJ55110.1 ABC-2 family transporter protein [Clostridium oryzae]